MFGRVCVNPIAFHHFITCKTKKFPISLLKNAREEEEEEKTLRMSERKNNEPPIICDIALVLHA